MALKVRSDMLHDHEILKQSTVDYRSDHSAVVVEKRWRMTGDWMPGNDGLLTGCSDLHGTMCGRPCKMD